MLRLLAAALLLLLWLATPPQRGPLAAARQPARMMSRRAPVSWARGVGARRWQLQALQVAQRGLTYERWHEEARLFLAKQKVLLRGAMVPWGLGGDREERGRILKCYFTS